MTKNESKEAKEKVKVDNESRPQKKHEIRKQRSKGQNQIRKKRGRQ